METTTEIFPFAAKIRHFADMVKNVNGYFWTGLVLIHKEREVNIPYGKGVQEYPHSFPLRSEARDPLVGIY